MGGSLTSSASKGESWVVGDRQGKGRERAYREGGGCRAYVLYHGRGRRRASFLQFVCGGKKRSLRSSRGEEKGEKGDALLYSPPWGDRFKGGTTVESFFDWGGGGEKGGGGSGASVGRP